MKDQQTLEALNKQYEIANNLYIQEDNLNWKKFEHLFYINAAIFFLIGFTLEKKIAEKTFLLPPVILFVIICLVGLTATILLGVSIKSGIHYLHLRKEALCKIEERLVKEFNGSYIVQTQSKFGIKSPTSKYTLASAAWFIGFIWIFLISYTTFNNLSQFLG